MGFCAEPGVARSAALTKIPERAAICHDLKALVRRFGDTPALKHDVMLYGFLLSADPGGCSLASLAEKYLEEPLDADPAAHADAILRLYRKLASGSRGGQARGTLRNHRPPARRVYWRAWKKAASGSIRLS